MRITENYYYNIFYVKDYEITVVLMISESNLKFEKLENFYYHFVF